MLLEGVISSTIEACNTEDETEFCCFKSKEEGMMSEEGPPSPFNNSIYCTRQERVDARGSTHDMSVPANIPVLLQIPRVNCDHVCTHVCVCAYARWARHNTARHVAFPSSTILCSTNICWYNVGWCEVARWRGV